MKRKINIAVGIIMLAGGLLVAASELMRISRHIPSRHPISPLYLALLFIGVSIYFIFFKDKE